MYQPEVDQTCEVCGVWGLCPHRDRSTVRTDLLPDYDAMVTAEQKEHAAAPVPAALESLDDLW